MGIYEVVYNCNNDSDNPDDYCCGTWSTLDPNDSSLYMSYWCDRHRDPPVNTFSPGMELYLDFMFLFSNTLKLVVATKLATEQRRGHVLIEQTASIRNQHGKSINVIQGRLRATDPRNSTCIQLLHEQSNVCRRNSLYYRCFDENQESPTVDYDFLSGDIILTLSTREIKDARLSDVPLVKRLKSHLKFCWRKTRLIEIPEAVDVEATQL